MYLELKEELMQRKATFQMFWNTANVLVEASYRVAQSLGAAGKPNLDCELVKQCLVETVKCIHSDKEIDFDTIPLSRDTAQLRQCTIAEQRKHPLMKKMRNSKTQFFLAIDVSNDICDSAQLLILI